MTSDMKELFKSENSELTIEGYESKSNYLLMITIECRKFYFTKYPENIVNTLSEFQRTGGQQEYFRLEDYSGFIQKRGKGYRIHLEMVNSDLTGNDLRGITKTIQDYFQVQNN